MRYMLITGLAERLHTLAKKEGLYYPVNLLRGIEAALSIPRRFLIFHGPPGAGKSRLAQLIAEAMAAELRLVPVQAGWRDNAALIGVHDAAQDRFLPGELVSLIGRAAAEPGRTFILCLEELSLGDPDGYLASVLCGLDADPPRLHLGIPGPEARCGDGTIGGELPLPDNLLFLGTLYMEAGKRKELPRKLLDRAALIELDLNNPRQFLSTQDALRPGDEPLLAVFETLQNGRVSASYRVFREIRAALAGSPIAGASRDAVLDQLLKSRVLPAISGEAADVEDCLRDLVKLLSQEEVRFPETLDKAMRMLEELELHGYTAAYLS